MKPNRITTLVKMETPKPYVLDLSEVGAGDVALVGGKCASLGELFRELTTQGVRAVDGFSTTSHAYEVLLETAGLRKQLQKLLTPFFRALQASLGRG